MGLIALLCSALSCAVADDIPPVPPADRETYESRREEAGRDPAAHVRLALWCEAHGLNPERLTHLAKAVLYDPRNATARGLLGLVAYRDRWENPEQVRARIAADAALTAKLAEYNGRRAALARRIEPGTAWSRTDAASAHATLGLWCESQGLDGEAKAHFTSAVVLDPYRAATWEHLGYVKHDGRWMSHEQMAAERDEAVAQRKADQHWEPTLKKWKSWLREESRRNEAMTHLNSVVDPRAVPAIVKVFRDGTEDHEQIAVRLLAKVEAPAATRRLTELAVLGPSAAVRSSAGYVLHGRPPRDFVGILVDQIHSPMKYAVHPVQGPGSPGALAIETPRFRMLRTYDAPLPFVPGGSFRGYVGYDGNGMPLITSGFELDRLSRERDPRIERLNLAKLEQRTLAMIAEANVKATVSARRMIGDVQAIEESNASTNFVNERITDCLRGAVDAPTLSPGDEDGWHRWWYDQLGYRYDPPKQVVVAVNASPQVPGPYIQSCFVAGTLVRTREGPRPIEGLQVGDHVLSQDTTTGSLTFQPVTVVHHNPPGVTRRLELDDGEVLVPSIYHRFWRAGLGWTIARDLKPGDVLRTLAGHSRINAIDPGPVVPLFNLDVAESRSFFVGAHGVLVHDNTLPPLQGPVFDAGATLAVSK
jgi:hypothetical protein